jgi:hypothetical protein
LNHHPPPEAFENGKGIAVVGKKGTRTHKGKQEINFEYSSFKPVVPSASNSCQCCHSIYWCHNEDAAEISATATTTKNDGTTQTSIPHFPVANQTAVTPSLPHFSKTNEPATNDNTAVPQANLTPCLYLPGLSRNAVLKLTRVSPNELGDCPASEIDSDDDSNRGTSAYCDPIDGGFWGSQ